MESCNHRGGNVQCLEIYNCVAGDVDEKVCSDQYIILIYMHMTTGKGFVERLDSEKRAESTSHLWRRDCIYVRRRDERRLIEFVS